MATASSFLENAAGYGMTFENVPNGNSRLGRSNFIWIHKIEFGNFAAFLAVAWSAKACQMLERYSHKTDIYIYIYVPRHYSVTRSRTNISNKKLFLWYPTMICVQCAVRTCIQYTNVLIYLPLWFWHTVVSHNYIGTCPSVLDIDRKLIPYHSLPTGLNDPRLPVPLLHHPKAWPRAKEPAMTVSVDKPPWHPEQLKDSC